MHICVKCTIYVNIDCYDWDQCIHTFLRFFTMSFEPASFGNMGNLTSLKPNIESKDGAHYVKISQKPSWIGDQLQQEEEVKSILFWQSELYTSRTCQWGFCTVYNVRNTYYNWWVIFPSKNWYVLSNIQHTNKCYVSLGCVSPRAHRKWELYR